MDSKQIDHSMKHRLPVMCGGIRYDRIAEYVCSYDDNGKRILSVGLLDKNRNCLVRVLAKKVEAMT